MDRGQWTIVVSLLIVAIVVIAGIYVITSDDGEDSPEKMYWEYTITNVEFTDDAWFYTYGIGATYSGSNSLPAQPDLGSYIWYQVTIEGSSPKGTTGTLRMMDFELTINSYDSNVVWKPTKHGAWWGGENITIDKTDSPREFTRILYFCVPGDDVTYVPQDGEYVLRYVGNMEVTL